MRRALLAVLAALALTLLGAAPVGAVECSSGMMFAQDHIVPATQAGWLGGDMNPGLHRGYSVCAR